MRAAQYIITKHLSVARGALLYMITGNAFSAPVLKQVISDMKNRTKKI